MLRVDSLIMVSDVLSLSSVLNPRLRTQLVSKKFLLSSWLNLARTVSSFVDDGMPSVEMARWYAELERNSGGALSVLISKRNPRTHALNRTTPEFVGSALSALETAFEGVLEHRPPNPSLRLAGNEIVEAEWPTGGRTRLDPFVLAIGDSGDQPVVVLYDGVESRGLRYCSMRGDKLLRRDAYEALVSRLDSLVPLLETVHSGSAVKVLTDRIIECTRKTIRRLEELGRYRPETFVERRELRQVFEAFMASEARLLLVEGPAGSGKTSAVAYITEKRLKTRAVFLELAERIAVPHLPDSLGSILRIDESIGAAFEAAASVSPDGRFLVAIDDLGRSGDATEMLISLLEWAERSSQGIKLLGTLRPDVIHRFVAAHPDSLSPEICMRHSLSAFSVYELDLLAEKLPVAAGLDEASVLATRRSVAARLGGLGSAPRRPGVAHLIMTSPCGAVLDRGFSARRIYGECVDRYVLECGENGAPMKPRRGALLRRIGLVMAKQMRSCVPVDDLGADTACLFDERGDRTADYEALLANGILAEVNEGLLTSLSFVDARMLEYAVAGTVASVDVAQECRRYAEAAAQFEAALGIAALLLLRLADTGRGVKDVLGGISAGVAARLVLEVAQIEPSGFASLFPELFRAFPEEGTATLEAVVDIGEPALAANAGAVVLAGGTALHRAILDRIRFTIARALFEVDDYDSAAEQLSRLETRGPGCAPQLLSVDISIARGQFAKAFAEAGACLTGENPPTPTERLSAEAAQGYCLARLGRRQDAEAAYRRALEAAPERASKARAEALGDLGALLVGEQRFDDATECFKESMALNQKRGSLVGIGVVKHLLGEMAIRKGKSDAADQLLGEALEIARRVGNRWREAAVSRSLEKLERDRGNETQAQHYGEGAAAIEKALKVPEGMTRTVCFD
ncbi:MAG: hypothetical protein ACRD16_05670 [Thermoanaerobaculia bacterium]